MESLYGEKFDLISSLWEIDSITNFDKERRKIENMLTADPFVLSLSIYDRRMSEFVEQQTVNFVDEFRNFGCRSRGREMTIEMLSLCGVRDADGQNKTTLGYRRRSVDANGEGFHVINVHFDLEKMKENFSTISKQSRDYAINNRESYDQRVIGTWSMETKSRLTAVEEVDLKGTLDISSTDKAGIYNISAGVNASAKLRKHASEFDLAPCIGKTGTCSWRSSKTGTLKIAGNRVLIVYDDSLLPPDRLNLKNQIMSGESDWGNPIVYRKIVSKD